jgi:alpha-L-rhamnosidase
MYRVVAGIDTYEDGPGYKHSKICPHPGGSLTEAASYLHTGYGRIGSHWRSQNDSLALDVEIPANTTSTVYIPAPAGGLITESGNPLGSVKDITVAGVEKGYLILKLGSGTYHFSVKQ